MRGPTRSRSRRGRHPNPRPHVRDEEAGTDKLPEASDDDQDPKNRRSDGGSEQLTERPERRRSGHDLVHDLCERRPVEGAVASRTPEHPRGHAHHEHEQEADEEQVHVGWFVKPRVDVEQELPHYDVADDEQSRDEEHETRFDIAPDEGRHSVGLLPTSTVILRNPVRVARTKGRGRRGPSCESNARSPHAASRGGVSAARPWAPNLRVHAIDIVNVEDDAHRIRRRRVTLGPREIQRSFPNPERCEGTCLTLVGFEKSQPARGEKRRSNNQLKE